MIHNCPPINKYSLSILSFPARDLQHSCVLVKPAKSPQLPRASRRIGCHTPQILDGLSGPVEDKGALSFPVSAVESRLVSPAAALLPESPPLVPAPKDAGQTRDPEDRHQHG
ncbi:MAG: hypothetical protein AAGD11_15900, partial [Planctomycetota bacterium]